MSISDFSSFYSDLTLASNLEIPTGKNIEILNFAQFEAEIQTWASAKFEFNLRQKHLRKWSEL